MTLVVRRIALTLGTLVACVVAMALAPSASAQAYPAKQVRIMVGVLPGGFTDSVARVIAPKLSDALGQQFIVENRPGASGVLAIDTMLKSPPDGYTLLITTNSEVAVNPLVLSKYPYDSFRDFAPIVSIAYGPVVIVANSATGFGTLQDFIAAARAKPGFYSYASPGNATTHQIAGELLASAASIRITHVPYKGGAPATQDVVGGHVPIGVLSLVAATPHLKTGRLKALAVTTANRLSFAPDLPTVAESGYPGFDASMWVALYGQPGIPSEVVSLINAEVNRALKRPDVRERLNAIGTDVLGGTPEDVMRLIRSDYARYERIVRESKIKAD